MLNLYVYINDSTLLGPKHLCEIILIDLLLHNAQCKIFSVINMIKKSVK